MVIPSSEGNDSSKNELNAAILQLHVQLFSAASTRSRAGLYLVIGASVLLFAAAWNSRPSGWMTQRLHTAHGAFELMGEMERAQRSMEDANIESSSAEPARPEQAAARENTHQPSTLVGPLTPKLASDIAHSDFAKDRDWSVEDVQRFLGYIDRGGFQHSLDVAQHIDLMREAKLANVQFVRVPFVGISFDVNDIGLIGGLTLTIFMVVYWFNLKRERDLLRVLGRPLVDELGVTRTHLYWLLNATQVLQVPPGGSGLGRKDMRSWLPRFLFFVPVFTQLFVIANDIITLRIGMMLSFGSTILTVALATLFLGMLVALTGLCLHVSLEIEQLWEESFSRLSLPLHERSERA